MFLMKLNFEFMNMSNNSIPVKKKMSKGIIALIIAVSIFWVAVLSVFIFNDESSKFKANSEVLEQLNSLVTSEAISSEPVKEMSEQLRNNSATISKLVSSERVKAELSLNFSAITFDKNEYEYYTVSFKYNNLEPNDIIWVSENSKVVTIEKLDSTKAKIIPKAAGESNVFVKSKNGDIISNKIKITITENPEAKIRVYTTPYGERYHYSSACAGKNSTQTSLKTAKETGFTPCKKCAH